MKTSLLIVGAVCLVCIILAVGAAIIISSDISREEEKRDLEALIANRKKEKEEELNG